MAERIVVGKVVSTHGIKGEVKVFPWTDNPEYLKVLERVYLTKDKAERSVQVKSLRKHKNLLIVAFEEVSDCDAAESLKDWNLEIDEKDLLPLPEGRYYIYQLVGLQVKTVQGEELGVLTEVIQTGANDVYVVQGQKEILIPALKSVVKKIDLAAKEMLVDPLPGLLEL